MRGRRGLFIVISAVSVILLALVGLYIYFNRLNAHRVTHFKQSATANWTKISEQSEKVTSSLSRVASPADLNGVSEAAGQMEKLVSDIRRSLKKEPVPSGYVELSRDQQAALAALTNYLEKTRELASGADEKAFQDGRGVLEDRSRKASSAVSEFLSKANFVRTNISNDFYEAALAMDLAWQPPQYGSDSEAQALFETASAFLNADVKESDFDKLWSMLSTGRITALGSLGITKEVARMNWRKLWGDRAPVDYFLSKNSIKFTEPDRATIDAVVYMEGGSPRSATMRLFRENGVWKVETYPFVGWL
jgi:hypothetical protein